MKDTFSTSEVARAIKVGKSTLLRWLQTGQLSEPKRQAFGGVECRIWSAADLERAKAFREERYRKRS
jgi:DNA-binding transcriptional MerR regulator